MKHTFNLQVEVTTISPNRLVAQSIMLKAMKSKLASETQGITALTILDGVSEK